MNHSHLTAKKAETTFASIPKIDSSNLRADFDLWPSLAREAWESVQVPQLDRTYSSIVFVGMGGSGIIGEVISDLAAEFDSTRIDVLKEYHLPRYLTNDSLVVCISCSGNTEETLSVLYEANKQSFDICTFGSGGLIEKFSAGNPRIRFTKTQMLKVPRSSFPGLFYPVLKFAVQNGFVKVPEQQIIDSLDCLERVRELCLRPNSKQNRALDIASRIAFGKTTFPLIYSSRRTRAIGLRFRQSLNENAKMHGFDGTVPEICHNDIVGWDKGQTIKPKPNKKIVETDFAPVFLKLEDDPLEMKTRFQIMEDILLRAKSAPAFAPFLGSTHLCRLLSMLYFLDYGSFYAAILRRVDPLATPSIDFLKTELKSRLDFVSRII